MNRRMDALIRALVLVRFGQELGSTGSLSSSIATIIDALLTVLR